MVDPFADESGARNDRDLVGTVDDAAGYRAADGSYLFLRLRLEDDPIPGGSVRPFAWGILLDTDSNTSTYEVLIQLNGIAGEVALHRNTTTTVANDPSDPPDAPAVRTYAVSTHARTLVASATTYGGDSDYFLDVAIPWSDLSSVGISQSTTVVAWAATSSTSSTLNGDLACHDPGQSARSLSGAAPSATVLDPWRDSDGDGYTDDREIEQGTNPHDASSHPSGAPNMPLLEGGGGCGAAPSTSAFALLVGLAWLVARCRHRGTDGQQPRR
jgi:hypothetical protein